MRRMNKTQYVGGFGSEPPARVRRLSRSFDTLEEAERFANGKDVTDIYRARGRVVVEWLKVGVVDDDGNMVCPPER